MVLPHSIKIEKNVINLCYHKDYFGTDVKWHFFATSLGKGACDGIGGTIKRLPRNASLQNALKSRSWHQDNFMTGLL
jgi:hypothetical protein